MLLNDTISVKEYHENRISFKIINDLNNYNFKKIDIFDIINTNEK